MKNKKLARCCGNCDYYDFKHRICVFNAPPSPFDNKGNFTLEANMVPSNRGSMLRRWDEWKRGHRVFESEICDNFQGAAFVWRKEFFRLVENSGLSHIFEEELTWSINDQPYKEGSTPTEYILAKLRKYLNSL